MKGVLLLLPLCASAVTLVEHEYGLDHTQVDDGYPYKPTLSAAPGGPTFALGYQLTDAAKANQAVCLDGSPPVYYHRKGTGSGANKWFVHQQGGGWCSSEQDCADRAKGALGSTKSDGPSMSLGASDLGSNGDYFTVDNKTNPMMYNWNAVMLRYCDGGSLTGDREAPVVVGNATLHFRGRAVLDAQIQSLLKERGMGHATDVVVSGCSAGGLAAFVHCDRWADAVAAATGGKAKVACVPDSGFFIDVDRAGYHTSMRNVYETHQSSKDGLDAECVAAHQPANEIWKCLFAEWVAPHISTPTFALQSQYDLWQSKYVANACSGWPPKSSNCNATIMNELGKNITARVKATLLSKAQHGVFLDSCQHHCMNYLGEFWDQSLIDGDFSGPALSKWYQLGSPALPNKGFYNQDKPYPCDDCCHQAPKPTEPPNCVQPITGGCGDSCCNLDAYCGLCGTFACQNSKEGACSKCYANGWCFPPCRPCYLPAPPPPTSQKYCGKTPTCMDDSPCCYGGRCETCTACQHTKTGLCATCWTGPLSDCVNCGGCWGWPASPPPAERATHAD